MEDALYERWKAALLIGRGYSTITYRIDSMSQWIWESESSYILVTAYPEVGI
jgi:hypothetical protein